MRIYNYFSLLPTEIKQYFLSFLDETALSIISITSKEFYHLSEVFWKISLNKYNNNVVVKFSAKAQLSAHYNKTCAFFYKKIVFQPFLTTNIFTVKDCVTQHINTNSDAIDNFLLKSFKYIKNFIKFPKKTICTLEEKEKITKHTEILGYIHARSLLSSELKDKNFSEKLPLTTLVKSLVGYDFSLEAIRTILDELYDINSLSLQSVFSAKLKVEDNIKNKVIAILVGLMKPEDEIYPETLEKALKSGLPNQTLSKIISKAKPIYTTHLLNVIALPQISEQISKMLIDKFFPSNSSDINKVAALLYSNCWNAALKNLFARLQYLIEKFSTTHTISILCLKSALIAKWDEEKICTLLKIEHKPIDPFCIEIALKYGYSENILFQIINLTSTLACQSKNH